MTKQEFAAAFAIANDFTRSLEDVDNDVIIDYGMPGFVPVHVTLEMVAKEIREQALLFNGKWDSEALDETAKLARRAFLIIG